MRTELCTSTAPGGAHKKDAREERIEEEAEVGMGKEISKEGEGGESPQKGAWAKGIGFCVCFHPCLCLSKISKYKLLRHLFLNSFSIWDPMCIF